MVVFKLLFGVSLMLETESLSIPLIVVSELIETAEESSCAKPEKLKVSNKITLPIRSKLYFKCFSFDKNLRFCAKLD